MLDLRPIPSTALNYWWTVRYSKSYGHKQFRTGVWDSGAHSGWSTIYQNSISTVVLQYYWSAPLLHECIVIADRPDTLSLLLAIALLQPLAVMVVDVLVVAFLVAGVVWLSLQWSLSHCDCSGGECWAFMVVDCYSQQVMVILLVVQPCACLNSAWGRGYNCSHSHSQGWWVCGCEQQSQGQSKHKLKGIRNHVIGLQKNCTSSELNWESQPLQKGPSLINQYTTRASS